MVSHGMCLSFGFTPAYEWAIEEEIHLPGAEICSVERAVRRVWIHVVDVGRLRGAAWVYS